MKRLTITLAALLLASLCPARATHAAPAAPRPTGFHTRKVAIVIYPGVEVLDFTGPAEVFAAAASIGAEGSHDAFEVYTVSRTKSPIVSQRFLHVVPDYSIEDAPTPDIVVLPGGGSQVVTSDKEWMEWVRKVSGSAEHVLTVCTGAFIAGQAGLLDGAQATTWYGAVPRLAKQFPKTTVTPGRRYVDNGKLITTAGVSAGIDGSLHLVARLAGRYVADQTAQYMEYKWTPEAYLAQHYSELDPSLDPRGQELQRAAILAREATPERAVDVYRRLTHDNPADAEAWLGLGRTLHGMQRYDEAVAANREAMKGAAQRATALYNMACELALTGHTDQAIDAAKQAVASGFRQRASYEGDTDLVSIREDPRFLKLLAGLGKDE